MEEQRQVTAAGAVALPVKDVELEFLKDTEGRPVVVRCEAVDETVTSAIFGLPGIVDAQVIENADQRVLAQFIEAGPGIVHVATALRGAAEGEWIRPAFHADDAHAVPGSVPWRFLRLADKLRVIEAILECSGYGGAAHLSFPDDDGARRRGGKRSVAARKGRRKNSTRGVA